MPIKEEDSFLKKLSNSDEILNTINDKILNNQVLSKQEKLLYDVEKYLKKNKVVKVADDKLEDFLGNLTDVVDDYVVQKANDSFKSGQEREQYQIARRLKKLEFTDEEIREVTKLKLSEIRKI